MPAPALQGSRGSVTITYVDPATGVALVANGFRISATATSASVGADWSLDVRTTLTDPSVVDADDQSYRATKTKTLPFNEFPTEALVDAEIQALVDEIFDELPTPAAP